MTSKCISLNLGQNEQAIRTNLLPSVSTVTYFTGHLPLQYLLDKTKDILSANPWLAGRLIKPWFGSLHLVYTPNEISAADYLVVVEDDDLELPNNYDNQYALTNANISRYLIKKGLFCWNKPHEPLFRVILVRGKADSQYALILSVSHILADGYTYYSIYKMYSSTSKVYAMNAERVSDFPVRVRKLPYVWIQTLVAIISIIWQYLLNPKLCKPVFRITRISPAKIKKIKASLAPADDGVTYVSSNDIIIAEFNKIARNDIVTIPVNFRNRLSGITSLHAGNYQAPIGLSRDLIASPFGPRKVLCQLLDIDGSKKQFANLRVGILDLFRLKVGLVTNWAGFYEDLSLPGSRLELHLPLMIIHQAAMQVAVVFKAKANETVVWIAWRGDISSSSLQAFDDALGE
jgi:hypothetical protein